MSYSLASVEPQRMKIDALMPVPMPTSTIVVDGLAKHMDIRCRCQASAMAFQTNLIANGWCCGIRPGLTSDAYYLRITFNAP